MKLLQGIRPGAARQAFELDQKGLYRWVGWAAAAMPLIMLAGGLLPDVCFYNSISHFYYARSILGDVFVGALIFIGIFLLNYHSAEAAGGAHWYEAVFVKLAGLSAFAVALFPADGAGCDYAGQSARILTALTADGTGFDLDSKAYFSAYSWSGLVHYGAAAIMFAFLAYYSFFVFTRVRPECGQLRDDGGLEWQKRMRNRIYHITGTVIVAAMALLVLSWIAGWGFAPDSWWNRADLTFVCEFFALEAFGFAWLIKGRAVQRLEDALPGGA